jgi:radical SAM superfamily enzyme YgiQ (UPF0313 family)
LHNISAGDERPVPGVWANTEGEFTFGGEQPALTIDDIPFPDRTIASADRDSYFIDWMKPIALLRTTVGCPYRCSFCSLWKIMDGHYYKRDVQRVTDELATIREECVFLVDDEPFVNGPRMLMLAQAIKAARIKKRYFAYCRIDTLLREREMMTAWREIGLERLFIGIEAVSAAELDDYNKRLNVAQIEDGLLAAKNYGIEIFAGFIVNTNYTQREFKQLVRFIEHHKVSYPSFTVLTPLPGTEALTTFKGVTEMQPNGRPNWTSSIPSLQRSCPRRCSGRNTRIYIAFLAVNMRHIVIRSGCETAPARLSAELFIRTFRPMASSVCDYF